jgi:hypothetical protein
VLKKVFLLILSFITALIIVEFIVGDIFDYPTYGTQYKVKYRKSTEETWSNIRKPYAKVLNIEGKTKTYYNNLGLPGVDITNINNPIVILGSSYVEALQFDPEDIATSLFQKKLNEEGNDISVINLGCSGHDPYDSWFRLKYFEQFLKFKPQAVFLVLNSDNREWFSRHPKPLDFSFSPDFGEINNKSIVHIFTILRNNSNFIALLIEGVKAKTGEQDNEDVKTENKSISQVVSEEMKECINKFSAEYKNFIVISILNDNSFNEDLAEYCHQNSILYVIQPLKKPEFLLNGAGHLNKKGNEELGLLLYKAYSEFIKAKLKAS